MQGRLQLFMHSASCLPAQPHMSALLPSRPRSPLHQILDTLAPMLEAAEAAAPPALSRSRLAQLQAASPRVQDSPIPSRAGSLPLPLPEVVVEEGRATADAGLVVPAQLSVVYASRLE